MLDWDEIENGKPRVVSLPEKEPHRRFGCLTIVMLVVVAVVAFVGGNLRVLTSSPLGGTLLPMEQWQQDLTIGLGYAGGALLFAAIFALLGVWTKYKPWNGIGLALLIAAVHAAMTSGYLAFYHYPFGVHMPTWPYALFSLLLTLVIWLIFSRWLASRPDDANYDPKQSRSSIGFAVFFGLLVSWVFVYAGAFGTISETIVAVLEAFAIAGVATAVLVLPFRYAPQFGQEKPVLSVFYSALLLVGLGPSLVAGRGFLAQGSLLGNLVAVLALGGAMLLVMTPNPDVRRTWPNAFVFIFSGLLIPVMLTDGLEMDFMFDGSGRWAQLSFVALAVMLGIYLLMIVLRRPFTSLLRQRWLGTVLGAAAIAGLGWSYFMTDGTMVQPNTFVVVLTEQIDTSFAREIEDRDERVSTVYNTLTTHASESQNPIRGLLNASGATYRPFYLINALEVSTYNPILSWQLTNRFDVSHSLRSPQVRNPRFPSLFDTNSDAQASSLPESAPNSLTWGLQEMEVEPVWRNLGIDGDGIVVGVADSGTAWQHPALAPNYRGADGNHDYNWFDPMLGESIPVDTSGHGTHTGGTAVGGNNIGVAPGAEWIACRNLPFNLGNPADYLACMEFLFAPFPIDGDSFTDGDATLGAHVTNNSWGCPFQEGCDGQTMGIGVLQLRNAGQMMVVSAGNSGPTCDSIGIPANNDDAFSVGAIDERGRIADFSSRGPALDYDDDVLVKPDVVAPGVNVISSWPGGGYEPSQGTSMAGPHVAGLVALIWSANADLIGNIDATEEIIRETAVVTERSFRSPCGPMSSDDVNNTYGVGMVNALAAVEQALSYDK